MKKVFSYLTAGLLTATLFTTQSCTKTCDAGYEGSDCKTESRAKFYKVWAATETKSGTTTPSTFSVTVGSGSTTDVTKISIANFAGVFVNPVTATVDGDKFTIPTQNPDADRYTIVSGTGTYNTSTKKVAIDWTLRNDTTSVTSNWTGTWQ
ncbi:MAG: hypothetical protein U0T84_04760 [Chitinophagales bacterium]